MALLEVTGVTVRFGGITAVNDASLYAEQGTITGLIGPNGAGKTTLFNVITGLQAPTSGRVRFRNEDVTRSTVDHRAKRGMARTFQRLEAFGSLTVRENIQVAREIHAGPASWFRRRRDPAVDEIIETVGLQPYVSQRADSVPTGVARLLEMGRALAIEPVLLLLDEPSSGLDEGETEEFGRLLQRLAGTGRSVLMVEHDMDLVMAVCDTIHVLEFGSVIATGTPAEIRADRRVQAAYLGFGATGDAGNTAAAAAVRTATVQTATVQTAAVQTAAVETTMLLDDLAPAETTMELPAVRGEPR